MCYCRRRDSATLVQMHSIEETLAELRRLPEADRTRLAFALLDSVSGPDPDAGLSDDQLRAEIFREADVAVGSPPDSMSWEEAVASIRK